MDVEEERRWIMVVRDNKVLVVVEKCSPGSFAMDFVARSGGMRAEGFALEEMRLWDLERVSKRWINVFLKAIVDSHLED